MTDIGSYAVCLILRRMNRSHKIRPRLRVTPAIGQLVTTCTAFVGRKAKGGFGTCPASKSFIKPLEGLRASCHLPEGLVSWLSLPTTSLAHRQQSAEGEKPAIWLPPCVYLHPSFPPLEPEISVFNIRKWLLRFEFFPPNFHYNFGLM